MPCAEKVVRTAQSDGGGEFLNEKSRDLVYCSLTPLASYKRIRATSLGPLCISVNWEEEVETAVVDLEFLTA